MSTKTDDTVQLLGQRWRPFQPRGSRAEWLELVRDDHMGAPVLLERRRAEELQQERQLQQRRDQDKAAARERQAAEFAAAERVAIGGETWVRHPDDPTTLIGESGTKRYFERTVREWETERATDAARREQRQQEQELTSPTIQSARLAALELELAALKGQNRSTK